MIAIVDYGLGNIRAFGNVYKRLNMPFRIASRPEHLKGAEKLILPGVGAFDEAMELLSRSGMRDPLDELVLGHRVPVLGVCVGMQIMARSSEEGVLPGLGWVNGEVRKFEVSNLPYKTRLPHMGWNNMRPRSESVLLKGLPSDSSFYFLHSYYFHCLKEESVVGEADYGGLFTCVISSEHIHGVQFHPEKSHSNGVLLLKNFGEL